MAEPDSQEAEVTHVLTQEAIQEVESMDNLTPLAELLGVQDFSTAPIFTMEEIKAATYADYRKSSFGARLMSFHVSEACIGSDDELRAVEAVLDKGIFTDLSLPLNMGYFRDKVAKTITWWRQTCELMLPAHTSSMEPGIGPIMFYVNDEPVCLSHMYQLTQIECIDTYRALFSVDLMTPQPDVLGFDWECGDLKLEAKDKLTASLEKIAAIWEKVPTSERTAFKETLRHRVNAPRGPLLIGPSLASLGDLAYPSVAILHDAEQDKKAYPEHNMSQLLATRLGDDFGDISLDLLKDLVKALPSAFLWYLAPSGIRRCCRLLKPAKDKDPKGRYGDIHLGLPFQEEAFSFLDADQARAVDGDDIDRTAALPITSFPGDVSPPGSGEDEDASLEDDEPLPAFAKVDGVSVNPGHPVAVNVEDLPPDFGDPVGAEYGRHHHYRGAVSSTSMTAARECHPRATNPYGFPSLVIYNQGTCGRSSKIIQERRRGPSAIWTPAALDDEAYRFSNGVSYLHQNHVLFFDIPNEFGSYDEFYDLATEDTLGWDIRKQMAQAEKEDLASAVFAVVDSDPACFNALSHAYEAVADLKEATHILGCRGHRTARDYSRGLFCIKTRPDFRLDTRIACVEGTLLVLAKQKEENMKKTFATVVRDTLRMDVQEDISSCHRYDVIKPEQATGDLRICQLPDPSKRALQEYFLQKKTELPRLVVETRDEARRLEEIFQKQGYQVTVRCMPPKGDKTDSKTKETPKESNPKDKDTPDDKKTDPVQQESKDSVVYRTLNPKPMCRRGIYLGLSGVPIWVYKAEVYCTVS